MKAVALSMTDARIVDITHDISPHNIPEGAFILQTSVSYFPRGTVHVAVVDPGVGGSRRGIVITTNSQILVGPDNGLLLPAARQLGNFNVYEISNPDFMLNPVSNTFHGRDVFTPIAAHILNGVLFEEIGSIIQDYVQLDFGEYEITGKTAMGKVIYIDHFGNIITNIDGFKLKQFLNFDKKIMLFIGDKQQELSFVQSYSFVKKGELLSTIGSSNLFEIALSQGDASKKLGVKPNDGVKILFG
jgi:S-adenosylmethionine hydrolase